MAMAAPLFRGKKAIIYEHAAINVATCCYEVKCMTSHPQSLCCDINVLIVQRCWKHSTSGEAMAHAVTWWCGTHVATSLQF